MNEEEGKSTRFQRSALLRITNLQPLFFFLDEHAFFDHLRLDGHTGKSLKAQPNVFVSCLERGD